YAGIENGIKRLSVLNIYMAAGCAVFILIGGPGTFLMDSFTETLGQLLATSITFSFVTESPASEQTAFLKHHLVFGCAYIATWAMLHSVFAARISRGRTVKEMILTYLIAPTALSWVATGILGGIGVHRQMTGRMDILSMASDNDPTSVVPTILETLPLSGIVMVLFIIIATIFLTTTLDSTTFSIAAYTRRNDMSEQDPSRFVRILVSVIITVLALAL